MVLNTIDTTQSTSSPSSSSSSSFRLHSLHHHYYRHSLGPLRFWSKLFSFSLSHVGVSPSVWSVFKDLFIHPQYANMQQQQQQYLLEMRRDEPCAAKAGLLGVWCKLFDAKFLKNKIFTSCFVWLWSRRIGIQFLVEAKILSTRGELKRIVSISFGSESMSWTEVTQEIRTWMDLKALVPRLDLPGSGYSLAEGSCELCNESSGYVNSLEFF
jgi:hypothetical protein